MKRYISILALLLASQLYPQAKVNINNLVQYGDKMYKADDEKPYTGRVYDSYNNGNKKLEGSYRKGINTGKWTVWYDNGKKRYEGFVNDNIIIGKWKFWYKNGEKYLIANFNNNKESFLKIDMFGKINTFSVIGWEKNILNLIVHEASHTQFKNKVWSKEIIFTEPNNYLVEHYYNKFGEKILTNGNGKLIQWYENGLNKTEITYKNGVKDGICTSYFENGKKSIEGTYNNGQPNGLFTWWHKNGNKKYQVVIKGSINSIFIKIGNFKYWDENGQKRKEQTFKNGKLIDDKCWDENGSECECGKYPCT